MASEERTEREAMAACNFKEEATVEMLDAWMRDAQKNWGVCEQKLEEAFEESLARDGLIGHMREALKGVIGYAEDFGRFLSRTGNPPQMPENYEKELQETIDHARKALEKGDEEPGE